MHPAPSVILFTSLSGLGFGLLFWLGFGYPGVTGGTAFVFFAIAYLLAVGGLMASTFHLGKKSNAIKAFSQWRSSWLSREAWLAVISLIIMGLYGAGLVFLGTRWTLVGYVGGLLSLATVFSTSMIYAQLKSIPRWNMPLTPALFLSYGLAGGALLSGQIATTKALLLVLALVQVAYWALGDRALITSGTSMASATGLGKIGAVKAFEPPHTGTNYLLREMVYVVGRKHSAKLRIISLLLVAVLPMACLLLPFNHLLAALAVISHIAGVFAARWLFFAEAEHVVGLYYGKR
ncbi:dimethyl sulfoxide reductase anchor subunit family protein [Phaeobacter marinintestinus]|uniref:dimethyl sulfoxide reductase anchor subunit family protein n=1 Tax=Falsiphaeobacter marinintestinus TaxID=1492905 RepID=UPI0011B4DA9E|nr:DmsC/YnfH family molybdoenzyme membrane anchor subunit [Phaeobacter marinintestinus]